MGGEQMLNGAKRAESNLSAGAELGFADLGGMERGAVAPNRADSASPYR